MPSNSRQNFPIIAPSILSADFSKLGTEIRESVRAGCSWIHLDIMDNHFVPNLTFGPPVVAALRKASKKAYFDAHLMTETPQSLIEAFAAAGVQNLTVHQEACRGSLPAVLDEIKALGMRAGVSIKPGTPMEAINTILSDIDLLLIMTVEPGFGGQAMIPNSLNKIREAKQLREQHSYTYQIQADGGINADTIGLVVAAGAEILVAGSAVFNSTPVKENVDNLMKSLK